jgi:hypothetical protein
MTATTETHFPLGQILCTPGVLDSLPPEQVMHCVRRHARGDWGEVTPEDRAEIEFALHKHLRLFSVYHADDGTKFWVITEADRSATTVLLPEEY